MLPVPSGGRSAGARLCAWWLGSRSWQSRCCVSNRPSLSSSSKPLRRCCCVVSLPCPPACRPGIPHPLPSVLLWLWLARCTLPPVAPAFQGAPGSFQTKGTRARASLPPFVLPGKGLTRAGGPLASQQGALDVFRTQTTDTNGMGTSPAGTAARGALLLTCLSSAPCQLPEVESFWEDLRGLRVTW